MYYCSVTFFLSIALKSHSKPRSHLSKIAIQLFQILRPMTLTTRPRPPLNFNSNGRFLFSSCLCRTYLMVYAYQNAKTTSICVYLINAFLCMDNETLKLYDKYDFYGLFIADVMFK